MSQAAIANIIPSDGWSRGLPFSVNALPPSTSAVMAALLRVMGVDLGDEREVIRVLTGARFNDSSVKAFMDEAIAAAH